MTRSTAHRAPRTALVAGALAVVTTAAHTAGGGAIDPLSGVLVLALSLALASGVAARPLSPARLIAAVIGAQAVLHLVMTVAGSHGHHAAHGSAAPMVLAHVLAAILTTIVVVRADGAVAAWARLVDTALGTALTLPSLPAVHGTPVRSSDPDRTVLQTLLHGVERRGPPRILLPQHA